MAELLRSCGTGLALPSTQSSRSCRRTFFTTSGLFVSPAPVASAPCPLYACARARRSFSCFLCLASSASWRALRSSASMSSIAGFWGVWRGVSHVGQLAQTAATHTTGTRPCTGVPSYLET